MAFNFPASPNVGDIYSSGGATFQFDGIAWNYTNTVAVLAYNQANAAYTRANSAAQITFGTVIANGSSVVATSNNDTLTIIANANVSIVADTLTKNITFDITNTGVTAATYGNSTILPVFTVDTKGRLTSVTNTAIDTTIATAAFARANAANLIANLAFDKANTANITADSAFARANAANLIANLAFDKANTANVFAVAAFGRANTANITADSAFARANAANLIANLAFDKANTANVFAVAAFNKANTGTGNSVVFISDLPPTTNLSNGSLWWNSNDGSLYVYYGDGSSTQWVITSGGLLEASNASTIAVAAFGQANTAYSSAVLKTGNTMTGNLVMSGANISFVQAASNLGLYWAGETSFIHSPASKTIVIGTSSNPEVMRIENFSVLLNGSLGVGTGIVPRSSLSFDITGASAGRITTLTDAATITPNFSSNNNFTVTLGGNRTLANATAATPGQSGVIYVAQDGTGSRTLSFGLAYKFPSNAAPTLTTTANAVDAIIYSVRTANSYVCQVLLNVGNRNDT